MNIDDLTEELRARAGELPRQPVPVQERLAGVQQRVQQRRRRQAALGAGLVAAVAVGALSLPGMAMNRSQLPANPAADALVTTRSSFPAMDGDDPLIASTLGRPGQRTVSVTFTPRDLDLRLQLRCDGLPDGAGPATVTVDGRKAASCGVVGGDGSTTVGFLHAEGQAANRRYWAGLGLTVGRPTTLTMRVTGDEAERARLGLGVYERTGPRTTVGDKQVQQAITWKGRRQVLVAATAAQLTGGMTVVAPGASAEAGWVVCGGSSGSGTGTDQLLLDGQAASKNTSGGYGCLEIERPVQDVTATSDGDGPGSLVLALYRPAG